MKKKLFFLFCCLGLIVFFLVFYKERKSHCAKVALYCVPHLPTPLLEIEIESKKHVVGLDSGSPCALSLRKEVLESLQYKEKEEENRYIDIHGNVYSRPQFLVPEMKIINFKARSVCVTEESVAFLNNAYMGEGANEQADTGGSLGRIGMGLFEQVCVCIDLPHFTLYIARNLEELQKESGLLLGTFVEVPLVSEPKNAVFEIQTDRGLKRVIIDTGSQYSLWHDPDPTHRYQFVSADLLLGTHIPHKFISYDLGKINVDLILGMDFLKTHIVLIDFPNRKAYIQSRKLSN